MALTLTITDAGRAALINAQHTGTAPVTIAQVGFSAAAFTPLPIAVTLPAEIKRVATLSGDVVAADTIHLTVRDESADNYTVRGFGLYLGDGTLFALYGQSDPVVEKSVSSILLLAIDVRLVAINAADIAFGDTNFLLPPATTERKGVAELATDAEAIAGVDSERPVTPKGLAAAVTSWLDARFGAGAPSAFVKGLLATASAAIFRQSIGLDAVNNTADANKPVSGPQQQALDLKVAKAGDTMSGGLGIGTIPDTLLKIGGDTPRFRIRNTASANKEWDVVASGNNLQVQEVGAGTPVSIAPGGGVTLNSPGNFAGGTNFTTPHLMVRSGNGATGDTTRLAMQTGSGAQVYFDAVCDDGVTAYSTLVIRTRSSGGVTEKFRLSSNGNATFQGNIEGTKFALRNDAPFVTGANLTSGSNSFGIGSQGAAPMMFFTNNTERLRINQTGQVGLGTNAPDSRLHVLDATGAALRVGAYGNPEIWHNATEHIFFGTDSVERARVNSIGSFICRGTLVAYGTGGGHGLALGGEQPYLSFYSPDQSARRGYIQHTGVNGALVLVNEQPGPDAHIGFSVNGSQRWTMNPVDYSFRSHGPIYVGGNTVWHAGNDGAGSGLDADLLDGWERDAIRAWENLLNKPSQFPPSGFEAGSNLVAGGYMWVKLPSGDILQAGRYTGTVGDLASVTITLPYAFPNMCMAAFNVVNNPTSAANVDQIALQVVSLGTTSITFVKQDGGGGTPSGFNWFAIGR